MRYHRKKIYRYPSVTNRHSLMLPAGNIRLEKGSWPWSRKVIPIGVGSTHLSFSGSHKNNFGETRCPPIPACGVSLQPSKSWSAVIAEKTTRWRQTIKQRNNSARIAASCLPMHTGVCMPVRFRREKRPAASVPYIATNLKCAEKFVK